MNQTEQLDSFSFAMIAFKIRFESDLATRWEDRESDTSLALAAAQDTEKYRMFQQFFEDVKSHVVLVIHRYFPSLLQIAVANHERLAGKSPLEWTHAEVLTRVCDFLGIEEVFNAAFPPRDDSRVLASAERLATRKGWLSGGCSDTFILPRWAVAVPHPVLALRGPRGTHVRAEVEMGMLSRVETLEWIKLKEFIIRKRIERQLEDEMWDSIIEAGKTGINVLDPVVRKHLEKKFPRELKLGQKKSEMSRYLDSAGLTDRQYEIGSLRYEYHLGPAEIGHHLGLHHSTVQEALSAVNRKMTQAEQKQNRDKNRAKRQGGFSGAD